MLDGTVEDDHGPVRKGSVVHDGDKVSRFEGAVSGRRSPRDLGVRRESFQVSHLSAIVVILLEEEREYGRLEEKCGVYDRSCEKRRFSDINTWCRLLAKKNRARRENVRFTPRSARPSTAAKGKSAAVKGEWRATSGW